MLAMVFSTPLETMPSPPRNCCSLRYMLYPRRPASTAAAILAAQEGLAPSQIMPEIVARALTRVWAISS